MESGRRAGKRRPLPLPQRNSRKQKEHSYKEPHGKHICLQKDARLSSNVEGERHPKALRGRAAVGWTCPPAARTPGHSLIWAVPATSEPGLVTSAVHKVWPDGVPHEPPRSEFPARPQPWPPDPGGTSSLHCSTWHGHGWAPDWTVPSHRRQKRPRRERLRAKRLSLTEGKLTSRWPGS